MKICSLLQPLFVSLSQLWVKRGRDSERLGLLAVWKSGLKWVIPFGGNGPMATMMSLPVRTAWKMDFLRPSGPIESSIRVRG